MKELGVARAEEAGLVFAFRARTVATLAVAAAVSVLAAWPRSLVYVCFAGAFFVLGYIPFALRRHPWAEAIKLSFVVLDVLLITAAVMNVPATMVWIDWPIQTRLRSQNFLLLLLLLGEAALTYSPRRVLWTGAWIMGVLSQMPASSLQLKPGSLQPLIARRSSRFAAEMADCACTSPADSATRTSAFGQQRQPGSMTAMSALRTVPRA
jgi:hypothetical protein